MFYFLKEEFDSSYVATEKIGASCTRKLSRFYFLKKEFIVSMWTKIGAPRTRKLSSYALFSWRGVHSSRGRPPRKTVPQAHEETVLKEFDSLYVDEKRCSGRNEKLSRGVFISKKEFDSSCGQNWCSMYDKLSCMFYFKKEFIVLCGQNRCPSSARRNCLCMFLIFLKKESDSSMWTKFQEHEWKLSRGCFISLRREFDSLTWTKTVLPKRNEETVLYVFYFLKKEFDSSMWTNQASSVRKLSCMFYFQEVESDSSMWTKSVPQA
ncbi:hypothetical protein AVEN_254463-1 [Araneus ventricosus]|uniref:Uncharacterized protein n=1 Tax=Araneus ventricosus TaxID=182803 RepID=A0A4Y2S9I1_ARAVE|nr:hypothetical protein AVEN_254463-1 [Araneus ventricosus]